MANSFNSKEIIKIIPNKKRTAGQSPARVVRGLYVTGVWRPPHYIDRTLIVDTVSTTHVGVYSYTTEDVKNIPCDMSVGYNEICESHPVTVTKYTAKDYHTLPGDMSVGYTEICESHPVTLEKWETKTHYTLPGDMSVGYTEICVSKALKLQKLPIQYNNQPPGQPSLQVTSIITEHVAVNSN